MVFKIIKVLISLLLVYILISFTYTKYMKDRDNTVKINLKNICQNIQSSLYVIVFEDRNVTILDEENALEYMFIDKSALASKLFINCNAERKIFNIKMSVILKTEKDSIDIEPTYEKVRGYMGVIEKGKCYKVDNMKFNICER